MKNKEFKKITINYNTFLQNLPKVYGIMNLKNISLEEKCKLLKKFNLIKECEE